MKPLRVEMEQGSTLSICSCGKSKNGPFCDGSHKGSEHKPIRIVADEKKTVSICCCKQSKNMPFCDGTHKTLCGCGH